jgi:hypothetical protein
MQKGATRSFAIMAAIANKLNANQASALTLRSSPYHWEAPSLSRQPAT